MQKHTALPWEQYGLKIRATNYNLPYFSIAEVKTPIDSCPSEANAEFIVRAVNNHYKLIEALEKAYSVINQIGNLSGDKLYHHDLEKIKQALKEAGEEGVK